MKYDLPRMRAIAVYRSAPGGLVLQEVDRPHPCANEAVVRVAAVSLNRCEVERALTSDADGTRPGHDLAGTVAAAAEDGSGPQVGARVVGLVQSGAWAEFAAVPTNALAEIPATVSFAQAASLPAAGLTALHGLGKGGLLAAKRVLVVGATSGVGLFAVQLAQASGASVTAWIQAPDHAALVEDCGADHVVDGDVSAAARFGPFHLVIDAVRGAKLAPALGLLLRGGTYVLYGSPGSPDAAISTHALLANGGVRLESFVLFEELRHEPASEGLRRLLALVRTHTVQPLVEIEQVWTDIAAVARRIVTDADRVGQAVLHL